ncbi:DUF805 domain-containing protein [Caulobacter sp.]|jgi:uncharacterized membrane protein YhaH (DUF805 family)|uniref:DUF805 domain-containing protein n=1 Tax=Caulobacter sp. TaxID=78 RepID=UPI0016152569
MTLWRKFFGITGRLRRRDYWLLNIIAAVVITILDVIASLFFGWSEGYWPTNPVSWALWVLSFWISICLLVRRLHDRNKGPVWILVYNIPIVGWIWWIVEAGFMDGTQGPNRYGPSPKGVEASPAPQAPLME